MDLEIRIAPRNPEFDAVGRRAAARLRGAGLGHIEHVTVCSVYFLRVPGVTPEDRARLGALLADPVTQAPAVDEVGRFAADEMPTVEVFLLPGVMDPTAQTCERAVRRLLGLDEGVAAGEVRVRTATRYVVPSALNRDELDWMARQVMSNACIQRYVLSGFGAAGRRPALFPDPPRVSQAARTVPIRGLSDDALAEQSRRGHLFLSTEEMAALREHYTSLGRDPTDLELETFAQTWSEHCVHKTLKSAVEYAGDAFGGRGTITRRFDNLLADTIVAATRESRRDWCLSVFVDNAGIIALDDEFAVAVKVETHNHPSAIEPYGGAATGTGGCIRDLLGCGLGAKPIASTDVFCVGPLDWPADRVPTGALHPRRTLAGVVAGVGDYGNRMGVPTVNGAVCFGRDFLGNPLVFCGCVGLLPRDRIDKAPRPGDRIVLIGGRTGRDGIHGATFSSAELTDTHADEFAHAVQIGHPIQQKQVQEAILRARDHEGGCLFSAITDCGAGGLSSAVGEMAAGLGAVVELGRVPLKYSSLRYDEIWISEAQERMVLAVPPDRLDALMDVCRGEEVEASEIGWFCDDGCLRVHYDGQPVGVIDLSFLHDGRPRKVRRATWHQAEVTTGSETIATSSPGATVATAVVSEVSSVAVRDRLVALLARPDIASKEWLIRQYDHEVQGGSVVKPLVGPGQGPSDAAVVRPVADRPLGVAVGCGLCPGAFADPYVMAVHAVDEAVRNVICVGGDPERTALLDNFCWPAVDSPESLGGLVRACVGAHDAAVAYRMPFISGKDSLNNQFRIEPEESRRLQLPETIRIPPTLLITAVSVVDDVSACVTSDFKRPADRVVVVPPIDTSRPEDCAAIHQTVARWIGGGMVRAAHDISEGGLAVALAEMCIGGKLGVRIDLAVLGDALGRSIENLFAEGLAGYVLEWAGDDAAFDGKPPTGSFGVDIGCVTAEPSLILNFGATIVAEISIGKLAAAWSGDGSHESGTT